MLVWIWLKNIGIYFYDSIKSYSGWLDEVFEGFENDRYDFMTCLLHQLLSGLYRLLPHEVNDFLPFQLNG